MEKENEKDISAMVGKTYDFIHRSLKFTSTITKIHKTKRESISVTFTIEPHFDMEIFHLTRQAIQRDLLDLGFKHFEINFSQMIEKSLKMGSK